MIQIHIQQAIFSDERNDFSVKETIQGIVIPFLGTVLGSACVLFLKNNLNLLVQRILTGFAAGIMTAASVWSLLIPALEQSANLGHLSFLPSSVGFLIGIGFLLFLDRIIPHLHMNSSEAEGPHTKLATSTMLMLAVTLHNIPEGMAVGVVYAGYLYGQSNITAASAMALSFGIAIQNFPEGAIISMPLRAGGMKRGKSFLFGVLSGAAVPIGAVLTIAASGFFVPLMPYMLSFAAGAMIYVVIEELIPEMSEGKHSNAGTIAFSLGFIAMMILDTVFQ